MSAATVAKCPDTLNILVVEDDLDCAESLAMTLRHFGHEAWVAFSGNEAVSMAARLPLDLVLLDIGLPGMNGFEAARALLRQIPDLFIVAVTGYTQPQDRRRSYEAGIVFHLKKPVDLQKLKFLLVNIRRLIGDR